MIRVKIIPSTVFVHKETGRKVSTAGAHPAWSDSERKMWEVKQVGWTVIDTSSGTVGIGRRPFETREEIEKYLTENSDFFIVVN